MEAAQGHQATFPSRKDDYGPDLANLIELGRSLSAIEYEALLQRRRAFTGNMARMFQDIDLLLIPGVGAASPTVDEISALGEDAALLARVLTPTAPLDICGFPTITMPAGMSARDTPIGIQLAGAPFSEQLLCAAGAAFQAVTDFHRQRPPVHAFERDQLSQTVL